MNGIKDIVGKFIERLRNEPVLLSQIVGAVLSLAAVFGFSLPVATAGALMAAVQVIAGIIGRSQVTPVRSDPVLGVTS
jgi:uncharacterized membrane protein HdeD (DUF308 family)